MVKESCWLKNNCNHIDCDKELSMRLYKVNYLYDNAYITPLQRQHTKLYLLDERDRAAFTALHDIEEDIEVKIKEGINVFIHSIK